MRRPPYVALAVLAVVGVAAAFSPWIVPGATAQDLMTGITGPGPGHPWAPTTWAATCWNCWSPGHARPCPARSPWPPGRC
ncbi:hypothetical protein ACFQ0B_72450 [Nonomuraea thailandensis]